MISYPILRRLGLLVALGLLATHGPAAAADFEASLRGSLAPDLVLPTVAAAAPAPPLPPIELRSWLRMIHLVGLCLGFGTAMTLDGTALGWLRKGRAPAGASAAIESGGRLVAVGFALLWASGVALAALAVSADPAFLWSPKLWAKVTIVTALTANALVLHHRVLPAFAGSLSRPLDGRWRADERRLFVVCGAVSSTSWIMAFALGVLREWNQAAPFGAILTLWGLGMLVAAVAILMLLPSRRAAAPYAGPDRRAAP